MRETEVPPNKRLKHMGGREGECIIWVGEEVPGFDGIEGEASLGKKDPPKVRARWWWFNSQRDGSQWGH
jgi:hypothetical protein